MLPFNKESKKSTNPLLEDFDLPHQAPPFDQVETEHFLPAIEALIDEAKAEIDEIRNNPASASFENTIEALEFSGKRLSRAELIFYTISLANGDDDIRAIEEEISKKTTRFSNELLMNEDIFKRVKEVYDNRKSLKLNPEQTMLLENTYKSFTRNGALLSDEDKAALSKINERLSELSTKYKTNTVKSTGEYKKVIDNEDDLKGVPNRAKAMYSAFAEKEGLKGKWLIKLSPPPTDISAYAENRALREEISRASSSVASSGQYNNTDIVLEIIRLRDQKAKMLGFKNHAEFVLDDRMAKTPEAVTSFLEQNLSTYKPAAESFLDQVKSYAKKTDGLTDFKPWDLSYYSRKLKEEKFNLNLESLRPYFELENVLEGVKQHAQKLFDVSLQETTGKYPTYHEDVKAYEVVDNKTKKNIGVFYTDYYARPGAKSNGAWHLAMRKKGIENGEDKITINSNVCNFAKPTETQPTLLSLSEVTTVFHEFGHALHALLAEGTYQSLTCTSVKRDFVELPSQLLENWAKEKELLDTFARHHETGEALSKELITKMQEMENFDSAYAGMRQTFLAMLDMKWHTTDPKDIKSVEDLEDGVVAKAMLFPREGGAMSNRFGHLFSGGYSAGYYSYKWAEVLDADIFEEFKKKGLYHEETAKRLRDTIYSKGGTRDPMKLFKDMMGREPDPTALFRREGLSSPNTATNKKHKKRKPGPK